MLAQDGNGLAGDAVLIAPYFPAAERGSRRSIEQTASSGSEQRAPCRGLKVRNISSGPSDVKLQILPLRPTELLQFLAEGRQIHAHLGIMLKIWHQGANALQLARQLRSKF